MSAAGTAVQTGLPTGLPTGPPTALPAEYLAAFSEDPRYLNFASYGPPSQDVADTMSRLVAISVAGKPGATDVLHSEDLRARAAFARLTGFEMDQVTLVPHTSLGLFQVAFGIHGGSILVSAGEFPSNLYPWMRANEIGLSQLQLMGGPGHQVTPQSVADALSSDTVAVAVSAVDFRTGFRADLAGIRAAIGPDRLLLVDGIQGFGVADIDWSTADAVVVGAQKWVRGGWGAGALALSATALDRIRPVIAGWTGVLEPSRYDGLQHELRPDAMRFNLSNLSPFAVGGFATALELIETATIAGIENAVAAGVDDLLARLDAAGVTVLSPRERAHRAGLVVAGIPDNRAAEAHASLAAAGVSATLHGTDRIRLAVHATTTSVAFAAAADVLGEFA